MSTENPIIANFDGLEGLEELVGRLHLHVRFALASEPDVLEPGSIIRIAAHDFRRVGIELASDWQPGELDTAAAQANLAPHEIAVVAVAEDGFLKEREVVLGPESAGGLAASVKFAPYNADRPVAMQNAERGFSLGVHLVLAHEREPRPFQPHRKGTILASASFQIRSTRDSGGLDPKPLTEERIREFGLTKHSVLYLDCDGPLLELEHLDGQLDVYVSEPLLAAASHHRGDDRDAIIGGLAVEAICQLVHVVSRELADTDPPDGDRSAVLRMIRRTLADVGVKKPTDEVAALVRDDPHRVTGLLSGLDRRAQRLLSVVAGDDERGEAS